MSGSESARLFIVAFKHNNETLARAVLDRHGPPAPENIEFSWFEYLWEKDLIRVGYDEDGALRARVAPFPSWAIALNPRPEAQLH